ncbi:RagB/SusD family nutrient uptake outer membrane protein [Tenacibaculum sp. IB213877]|uniref:RagB/SusD family nutrient uptake outer membrane protein n=1 Tax=Tenacibaculum sp. IB213877 TaxID=3097351 RepID=UPI002A59FE25|nr:RagB/SusD family nutrient uptake outer membrane protein [Tenacibaculum sp. IB213877]MDY0779973.1 RagB/SusD family nutrient uptake outer membrane protein [Tenacibaculum sp. IB213877]
MKFTYKIIVFCLSIVMLNACSEDFIEVIPKGKLIAEYTEDYDKMFFNLTLINLGNTEGQVPLGDEVVAINPYFEGSGLLTQRLFRWEGDLYEEDQNAAELEVLMEQIYIYNKIINEVPTSKGGSESQKMALKAEALAGRAWSYFLLINYYGLPYNASTSSTDLGFPIIEEADLVRTDFKRATVKEVYDFIVNDLITAIPNLSKNTYHRMRISQDGAKALLGKVYVFMHKFNEASPLLQEALTQVKTGSLGGIEVGLYNYNDEYTAPLSVDDIENMYAKQIANNWADSSSELVLSEEAVALYSSTDLRVDELYTTTPRGNSVSYPNGFLRRSIGSSQSQIGIRVPELYLLNAEVKCRLNDLPGAVQDLEELRAHRMSDNSEVSTSIATNQEALLEFIFEERIREFALMGYRWFDMRRLTVDPLIQKDINSFNNHKVYDFEDGSELEAFTLTQNRLVFKFPQTIMEQNPNLENNP